MIRSWLAERLLDYLAFFPLKRGKYRLAQWASLVLDGAVKRSSYGPRLHCRFADSTFWCAARYGNDEVMSLLADLKPDDGLIDVGSNIGLTSCFAAGRGAAVLGLEPSGREFQDLLRNASLCDHLPVCLSAAACEQPGFLSFRVGSLSHSGGNSIGVARSQEEKTCFVLAVRLDDLLTEKRLDNWQAMQRAYRHHTLVVKVDVEGFEASVLHGMQRLLHEKRCRKVVVEVNPDRADKLGSSCDLDAFMAQFSYSPIIASRGRSHFDQCYLPD